MSCFRKIGAPPAAVLALALGTLFASSACTKKSENNTPVGGAGSTVFPSAGTFAAAGSGAGSTTVTTGGTRATGNSGSGNAGTAVAQAGGGATGTAGAVVTGQAGASGSGPVPSGVSEWTMIAHDASSTYYNPNETVLTKANAASLTMAWKANLGTNIYGAPLQVGDKIYASSGAGVWGFDATGKELWNNPSGTSGSLAYDSGVLYLYTMSGNIVAIDATTGKQKWSKAPKGNPGGDGSSSPVIAGNAVLIGGSSGAAEVTGILRFRGFLAALDKTTGDGLWTSFTVPENATGASLWSSAAADVAAGRAYGTTGNNHGAPATDSSDAFVAFDLMSGEIKWKNQRTAGDIWGPSNDSPDADFGANPVLYEAMVGGVMTKIVSSGQKTGQAHALKRDDGTELWKRTLCMGMNTRDGNVGIFVNGTWSGKNMLFACNTVSTSTLVGLDGATGNVAFMTPLPGPVFGRMSAANGVGFVGAGSNLIVFDTDSGMILKTIPATGGGTVAGTPTIANGRVAFGEGMTWVTGNVAGSTLTVLKVQ